MKELYAKCGLYLDLLPNESEEDAIERLYDLMADVDICCCVYTSEVRDED